MEAEVNKMTKQPSYRFAGYTEPWAEKKLGEVAEVNPKSVVPDEFKYVDLGAVVGTEMISYRNETIPTSPSRAQRLAIKGDIFYQTVRPYQKNNYLFEKDDNDYVFSTGYAQLRPSGDGCFLLSYLQTNKFVNVVLDNCTGTSYPAINSKDLSDIFISLPSLPEQTAIGSFFQDIDQLISLQQRKLEVLKEQKKTYLKLLFPAKGQTKPALRFTGFEDEWKEVKLGDLILRGGSGGTPKSTVAKYYGGDIPFLSITDISNSGKYLKKTEKTITNEGLQNSSAWVVPEGAISLAMYASVGKLAILGIDCATSQAFYNMVFEDDIVRNFVYITLEKANIYNEWGSLISTGTQANLNAEKVKNFSFLHPSKPEQEAIGSFFQDLDKAITKQEEKVNQLKESKQTLLRKMFI